MPVEFEELLRGGNDRVEFGREQKTVIYRAHANAGETTEEMKQAANAHFPTVTHGSLYFVGYTVQDCIDASTWELSVTFEGRGEWSDPAAEILDGFAFDTTGGSVHVETPLSTPKRYGPKASPQNDGVVGFDGQNVRGVDVPEPSFAFSITRKVNSSLVTAAYVQLLEDMTGTVNNAPFLARPAGSVLYLGAVGSRRGGDGWNLEWRFASKKNRSLGAGNPIFIPKLVFQQGMEIPMGFSVGDPIPIDKQGWQVLDVLFETVEDTENYTLARVPIAAYVREVIPSADFSRLGL